MSSEALIPLGSSRHVERVVEPVELVMTSMSSRAV